ncbi:uncharacterized protein TNIN_274881, partial [Trichonephila inaurata madagascariensis]
TNSECSAFHLPLQKRQSASEDFCSRSSVSSFRLQSSVSSYSYHHRHQHHSSFISTSVEGSTRSQHSDYLQSYDLTSADGPNRSGYSSVPSSGHVVQPVPHYLPINLKAFSQRMLYGYPMLNKPQYPPPYLLDQAIEKVDDAVWIMFDFHATTLQMFGSKRTCFNKYDKIMVVLIALLSTDLQSCLSLEQICKS